MTAVHRGVVRAQAVLLDVGLSGVAEARRRVMVLWADGADLRAVTATLWLLILPEAAQMRSETAFGQPLIGDRDTLCPPGLDAAAGMVTIQVAGEVRRYRVSTLPEVSTEGWFDLTDLSVHPLEPVRARPVSPARPEELQTPEPDLRSRAGLSALSLRRQRELSDDPPARTVRRMGMIVVLVLLTVGVVLVFRGLESRTGGGSTAPTESSSVPSSATSTPRVVVPPLTITIPAQPGVQNATTLTVPGQPGHIPHADSRYPWLLGVVFGAFLLRGLFRVRIPVRGRRSVRRRPRRRRGWFARLFLRSPARGLVGRRHERYVRSLTAKFERGQWHDALSDAIALGTGDGPNWLRLRLPRRRERLTWTAAPPGGGSIQLGDTAFLHLRGLYLDAARRLVDAGNIDQAAFVYAELLRDTKAAVTLLERTGRLRSAAELAEARGLDPELLVRLWWRAGDRRRAVDIARSRCAFAAAVERLTSVDAEAAHAFRAAWVAACRAAGDHLGAVEAAWPDPALRADALADIEAGLAVAGPASGPLFAHALAAEPTDRTVARALALLSTTDPHLRRLRAGFLGTLARLPGSDQATDRQVCTAAVRSLLQDEPTRPVREWMHLLRRRADPLAVADLPPLRIHNRRSGPAVDLVAPDAPGHHPVFDAVALTGRVVLTAHGDRGVRLLTADGRVRAHWDQPADRLVPADNGSSALLVRRSGSLVDVQRLDLVTRRIRPCSLLRLTTLVTSYDGGVAAAVDSDGIAFIDLLSERPRILWRELSDDHRVLVIDRTPRRLSALVDVPAPLPGLQRSVHLFVWELPGMTLRLRRPVTVDGTARQAALHLDGVLVLNENPEAGVELHRYAGYGQPVTSTAPEGTALLSNGAACAVRRTLDDGRHELTIDVDANAACVRAVFPADAEDLVLREHAGIVTVSDRLGRIVVADPAGEGLIAELRTPV